MYAKGRYDSVEVKYCDYGNINEEVNKLLDRIEMAASMNALPDVRRYILLTDISVNYNTAKRLDHICVKYDIRLDMIDHHQISDDIESFEWVHVNTSPYECGTSLLRAHLSSKPAVYDFNCWDVLDYRSTLVFVNDVCLYDTWQFDKSTETNAENLNILLGLLGKDEFEMILSAYLTSHPDIPYIVDEQPEYMFVEADIKKRKEYCALRNQSMKTVFYKGYKVGVVFAERYISSVGDYVLRCHPEIDFCAIVNLPSSVSLRGKNDSLNLGIEIARPLGGGGHPKAAGYQIKNISEHLIKELIQFNG